MFCGTAGRWTPVFSPDLSGELFSKLGFVSSILNRLLPHFYRVSGLSHSLNGTPPPSGQHNASPCLTVVGRDVLLIFTSIVEALLVSVIISYVAWSPSSNFQELQRNKRLYWGYELRGGLFAQLFSLRRKQRMLCWNSQLFWGKPHGGNSIWRAICSRWFLWE